MQSSTPLEEFLHRQNVLSEIYVKWKDKDAPSLLSVIQTDPPMSQKTEKTIENTLDDMWIKAVDSDNEEMMSAIEHANAVFSEMKFLNDKIPKQKPASAMKRTTEPQIIMLKPSVKSQHTPLPSAPPPPTVYPQLYAVSPQPQPVFVPPTITTTPDRFFLQLFPLDTVDKRNAKDNLLRELTDMFDLVREYVDMIPNLMTTSRKEPKDKSAVFDWLLGDAYVPTQYDHAEFTLIRNKLNTYIDEMFEKGPFSNEPRLAGLNHLLANTHRVMAAYYRLHAVFGHKTIQQEIAITEAKAKKEKEPERSKVFGIFGDGNSLSYQ